MKLVHFHTPISLKLQFSEGFALSVLGMFDYSLFHLWPEPLRAFGPDSNAIQAGCLSHGLMGQRADAHDAGDPPTSLHSFLLPVLHLHTFLGSRSLPSGGTSLPSFRGSFPEPPAQGKHLCKEKGYGTSLVVPVAETPCSQHKGPGFDP